MDCFCGLIPKLSKKTDGTNEATPAYQYSPLDESQGQIRLLVLLRGDFSSDVRIFLYNARLAVDSIPKYEALSYVWGSTENRINILVQSPHRRRRQKSRTLAVTQNLARALPYLRYKDRDRVLWIDAICINQNDQERGRQIRRMSDLYRLANCVVVWLGEERDDSSLALEALSMLGTKVHAHLDYTVTAVSQQPSELHWVDREIDLPFMNREWLSISSLLKRSYFGRLWIWQEIRLANRDAIIMCGLKKLPWRAFHHAVHCLFTKPHPTFLDAHGWSENVLQAVELSHVKAPQFQDLAWMTRESQCADPKDRIFALLSIASNNYADDLDYTESVEEIYRNFFVLNVELSGRLQLLPSCENRSESLHNLNIPSWVPDWSSPKVAQNVSTATASELSSADVSFIGSGVMAATGVHLATIDQVCASKMLKRSDFMDIALELRRISREMRFENRITGTSSYLEIFCRTICTNIFYDTFHPPQKNLPALDEAMSAGLWALNAPVEELETSNEEFSMGQEAYLSEVQDWLLRRSLFTRHDGHLGLAPEGAQNGDLIAVLLGCDSPMDFSNGEALLGPLPENIDGVFQAHDDGGTTWACINRSSGEILEEDPRLGPLPPGWQSKKDEDNEALFWNLVMREDEATWADPRMTPEALREKGVDLKTFELV